MKRLIFPLSCLSLAALLSACKPSTGGDVGSFKIGERAQTGPLIYTVTDTQWNVQLGKEPAPRIPKNRFLVLSVSVRNSGSTDQSVPSFNLINDQGEAYPELDNGEGVANWIGLARKIRPGETLAGAIAFDVEPKRYRLKVTEESDQKYAWIDIPLDFGVPPPTPDAPGEPSAVQPTLKR